MREILHIFRKDVHSLWTQIVILLVLFAVHAYFDVRAIPFRTPEMQRVGALASTLKMLLTLGIFFVIARAIFEEDLTTDRQFWLTRPYHRWKLLAAKVLFVVAFINVPLFLSDCYILAAQGFPVLGVLPKLLLRQVPFTVLFMLPSFVLATVTSGLAQFLMAWFIVVLAFAMQSFIGSFLLAGAGVIVDQDGKYLFVVALVGCSVILWQYATRGTRKARLMLLASLCAYPIFPIYSSLAQPTPLPKRASQSSIRIAYDLAQRAKSTPRSDIQQGYVEIRFPLQVAGLPSGTLLRGRGTVTVDRQPQTVYTWGSSIERDGDEYWQKIVFESWRLAPMAQPIQLRTVFDLEAVNDRVRETIPLTTGSFFVAGVGRCHALQLTELLYFNCRSGLEPHVETTMRIDSLEIGNLKPLIFLGASMPWFLSPTADSFPTTYAKVPPGAQLKVIPREKTREFQQELTLENIRLTDYALPH